MNIAAFGKTDVGMVRQTNEDNLLVDIPNGLFVVADGMGGHEYGEVASELAVSACQKYAIDNRVDTNNHGSVTDFLEDLVRGCVLSSNDTVYNEARRRANGRRLSSASMGTTIVVVAVSGSTLAYAHLGDSRLYMVRGGVSKRLTRDHSIVQGLIDSGRCTEEQAANHPHKNVITDVVGMSKRTNAIPTGRVTVESGDWFLLCSDGLTNEVKDVDIADILTMSNDPSDAVGLLIDRANKSGGHDNTTAVVIHFE